MKHSILTTIKQASLHHLKEKENKKVQTPWKRLLGKEAI